MANTQELNDVVSDITLLSGSFNIYPKTKNKYHVTVSTNSLSWTTANNNSNNNQNAKVIKDSLSFNDILGCDCMKGKTKSDTNAYMTVYAYPHRKKFASSKTIRKRQTFTFAFESKNSFEENFKEAEQWKIVITCLAKKISVSSPEQITNLVVPNQKKLLVLVNPFSGPGKALSIFQQRVVPIFAEANIHFNMVITEYAGHAYKLAQALDLDEWYGVIIVSGDGLIYEVVNGLMQRDDWEKAIKIPLGCLPGGSGNALCCALLYGAGEPYLDRQVCALHASYAIAKHDILPMDLVAVETVTKKQIFSFLSVAWGIIADVDIESEKYRSLGPVRFTMGAVVRILNLRKYRGRLSFLATEPYHPPQALARQLKRSTSEYQTKSDDNVQPKAMARSESTIGTVTPSKKENMNGETIEEEEESLPEGLEKVTFDNTEENEDPVVGDTTPAPDQPAAPSGGGGGDTRKIPTPLLPPIDEPVPSDWTVIETEFTMVTAIYQTHLASDMFAVPHNKVDDGLIYLGIIRSEDDFVLVAAIYQTHLSADMISTPDSRLNDGLIHLAVIRAGVTRSQLLKIMTGMETGTHIGLEGLEVIKCKAFRLEPLEENPSTMTVDGEQVDFGPIQAQVMPEMARMMVLPQTITQK